MTTRILRLAATALVAALALPAVTAAAAPAPPVAVSEWQAHLEHIRAMHGSVGAHVPDCVAQHGSMAGAFGPNGWMVEMMSGMGERSR